MTRPPEEQVSRRTLQKLKTIWTSPKLRGAGGEARLRRALILRRMPTKARRTRSAIPWVIAILLPAMCAVFSCNPQTNTPPAIPSPRRTGGKVPKADEGFRAICIVALRKQLAIGYSDPLTRPVSTLQHPHSPADFFNAWNTALLIACEVTVAPVIPSTSTRCSRTIRSGIMVRAPRSAFSR